MKINFDPDGTRVQDYVKAKSVVRNTPARLRNGQWFRLVDGKEIPEAEFLAANPIVFRPKISSLENADRKSAALR